MSTIINKVSEDFTGSIDKTWFRITIEIKELRQFSFRVSVL